MLTQTMLDSEPVAGALHRPVAHYRPAVRGAPDHWVRWAIRQLLSTNQPSERPAWNRIPIRAHEEAAQRCTTTAGHGTSPSIHSCGCRVDKLSGRVRYHQHGGLGAPRECAQSIRRWRIALPLSAPPQHSISCAAAMLPASVTRFTSFSTESQELSLVRQKVPQKPTKNLVNSPRGALKCPDNSDIR